MNGNRNIYTERQAQRDQRRAQREELRRQRREWKESMRGKTTLAHAVRGPITLITVGALFALQNFTPYGFDRTWPVILIVFGLLTLVGRGTAPVAVPPYVPPYAPPAPEPQPASSGPESGSPSPTGGYRHSEYAQAPAAGSTSEPAPRPDPQATPETSSTLKPPEAPPPLDALSPSTEIFAPRRDDEEKSQPREGGSQ